MYKDARIIGTDTELDRLLHKHFVPDLHKGYIEIGEDNYCLPVTYNEWAEKLCQFQVRNDDTFIAGFPRTGNTWTSEMVWLIVNDLNFEGAKERQIKRVPYLEMDTVSRENTLGLGESTSSAHIDMLTYIEKLSSPRCIKTHLPWSLLPEEICNGSKQPKIIYVLRNPKDACVSYYNLFRTFNGYQGPFEDFCLLFLEGRITYGPFWNSVLSFWTQKHRSNILFVKYKDMKEDLGSVVEKVANFLGKRLDRTQVRSIVEHLSIDKMRNNPAVNRDDVIKNVAKRFNRMVSDKNDFIGKGEQGGYASMMSPELIKRFDDQRRQYLKGTDLILE